MLTPRDVVYPVYPMGSYESVERSGEIVYLLTKKAKYIFDNKSLSGSFGIRRAKIAHQVAERKMYGLEYNNLYPLRRTIFTEEQLLVNLGNFKNYVDNRGVIFYHAPTTFYRITYHKVLRVIEKEGGTSLLMLDGVNTPIKLKKRVPEIGTIYAGVLNLPDRKLLYELSKIKKKDTRRKL